MCPSDRPHARSQSAMTSRTDVRIDRMLKIGLRAALVLVLSFFVAAGTKASAQSRSSQNIEIDCSAFQRQSDGSWIALHTTTIEIGTNSITVSGKVGWLGQRAGHPGGDYAAVLQRTKVRRRGGIREHELEKDAPKLI